MNKLEAIKDSKEALQARKQGAAQYMTMQVKMTADRIGENCLADDSMEKLIEDLEHLIKQARGYDNSIKECVSSLQAYSYLDD